jgi:hypothetical protein
VHCWGGFGSQLFAVVIHDRLKVKYPFRRVTIVFHDGGVTRRKPEVLQLLKATEFKQVSDFILSAPIYKFDQISEIDSPRKRSFIFSFKSFLLKVGLVSRCNTQVEFSALRPWVLEIRGHYTKITFTPIDFEFLAQRFGFDLSELNFSLFENLSPGIHFRLGDLLSLAEKDPIPSARIRDAILILKMHMDLDCVRLFSDSLPQALSIIRDFDLGFDLDVIPTDQNIAEAFLSLVQASAFIATPSKVSEWVILFRHLLRVNGLTLVPREMVSHFHVVSPEVLTSPQIRLY